MGFTEAIYDDLTTANAPAWIPAMQLARWQPIRAKLGQLANTNIPFNSPIDPSKPYDVVNNTGLQSKADLLFTLAPTGLLDAGPTPWERSRYHALEAVQPGLYVKVLNGSLFAYNKLYSLMERAPYRTCDPTNSTIGTRDGHGEDWAGQRFCADRSRTPLPMGGGPGQDNQGYPGLYLPYDYKWTTEQYIAWGIIAAPKAGADAARVKVMADWYARMWPQ